MSDYRYAIGGMGVKKAMSADLLEEGINRREAAQKTQEE